VGQRHGDLVVIDGGLSDGDRVVTNGQMLLQPGSAVMVVNPGAPGSPAASPNAGSASPKSPDEGASPKSETDKEGGRS
jgi:hypothetical protein